MTYWVLVLWLHLNGAAFQIIEFKTEDGCLFAKERLLTVDNRISGECVEIK